MENELMDINQLDFEEEGMQEQPYSVEEENFGTESNFTKDWMDGNYNKPDNTSNSEQEEDDNNTNKEESTDIITYLLNQKGIKDPSQIKFEGENGELETRDWNSLSLEEQYNILQTPSDTSDTDLDD